MDSRKSKCWASELGGCDSMSGEHIISNAVFRHGCSCPLMVKGVSRIRMGEPTYGAEKSNILCRQHNSMLSPLDSTVGKLAKFQSDASDESFNDTLYLEGELLERWLLKTVVNSGVAGWTGLTKFRPSADVVKAIFGITPLPERIGLYSVEGVDPNHRPSGSVSFVPIHLSINREVLLAGAYVSVHGRTFLGAFHDELASILDDGAIPDLMNRFSSKGLKHIFRPGCLSMERERGEAVYVGLSWNGFLRFSDGTKAPFPPKK